ncbi:phosphoglycerate mutase family protein [Striga asiatica]|uniref:Phosphoglycerate mutase family protein n=1 Tax=Striga asiatica TaxID=4170 RepID=A0A5A7P476_STRAF|nr:phosphoglycerate mutase family protein [Striga asiatica]
MGSSKASSPLCAQPPTIPTIATSNGIVIDPSRVKWLDILRSIKTLADKHPSQNLLLVTHGEGVGSAVSGCLPDFMISEVDYCADSVLWVKISRLPSWVHPKAFLVLYCKKYPRILLEAPFKASHTH